MIKRNLLEIMIDYTTEQMCDSSKTSATQLFSLINPISCREYQNNQDKFIHFIIINRMQAKMIINCDQIQNYEEKCLTKSFHDENKVHQ